MAQRLARVLCPRCAEEFTPDGELLEQVGFPLDGSRGPKLKRAAGCRFCSDTGYRGRVALTEVLVVTEEIERMIAARASTDDIRRVAMEQGLHTLRDDGMQKVAEGTTTIEEVLRVIA
jgi:type IV pilus assembly protein PilB